MTFLFLCLNFAALGINCWVLHSCNLTKLDKTIIHTGGIAAMASTLSILHTVLGV